MSTAFDVLEMVEEFKYKLTDREYMNVVDGLMSIHKSMVNAARLPRSRFVPEIIRPPSRRVREDDLHPF
tara:strand:+ start:162 stop:368 length:207 start_codon:yes stop_codon:yes gene_type:complete